MTKPLKEKVSITLDEDVIEMVRVLAEEDDRAFSSCVNRMLKKYIRYKSEIDKLSREDPSES